MPEGINVFSNLTPDRFTLLGALRSGIRLLTRKILPDVLLPSPAAVAERVMEDHGVVALSVAVAKRGAIVFSQGYGFADPGAKQPATADSLYRIASNSKAITATAIHVLAAQGKLSLTDRVFGPSGILGTTYGTKPYSNWLVQMEVRHLLSHTAGGWPNDGNDPMFSSPGSGHAALIGATLDADLLTRPPGVEHIYSNFGFCLLGRIIERRSDQSYEEFVRHSVLIPAGANGMRIGGDTLAQRAPGEVVYVSAGGGSPYGMPVRRMDSHGGWITSAPDYVRFLLAIDAPVTAGNVLTAPAITAMRTPWKPGATTEYGHGVVTDGTNIWHNGMLPGSRSVMWCGTGGHAWCAICTGGPAPGSKGKKKSDPLLVDLDKMMWRLWDLV